MSVIKTKLISTSVKLLDQLDDNKSEKYFLGDWCLQNKDQINFENYRYIIQKHHWLDLQKYKNDFSYLGDLNERLILALTTQLNQHHNVHFSTRYWRIIIGTWLLTFIPTVYDRWETLRLAFESNRIFEYDLHAFKKQKFIPNNFDEYRIQQFTHTWNNYIFSEILISKYANKVSFNKIGFKEKYPLELIKKRKEPIRIHIYAQVDKLLSLFNFKYKVIFVRPYFNFFTYLKLSLKLKQIPRLHNVFEKNIIFKKPLSNNDRKLKLHEFAPLNDFETFIKDVLFFHIPKSYLEGYKELENKASRVRIKSSIIFTANSHLSNDFFNHWCAKMIETGAILVTSQHGGALKQPQNLFLHQEKIADKMVVWHKPIEPNHVRLSVNKFAQHKQYCNGTELSIVALEAALYVYRAQPGPYPGFLKDDYKQKINFINNLSREVTQNIKVRAANRGEGHFNSRSRYKEDLGIEKISSYTSYEKMLSNSKIVVCTYPSTTYLEAMFSGIPTISLYKKDHWQFDPIFDKLIKILVQNKMIFYDSSQAAEHINNIWNNPWDWWNSDQVHLARKMFFETCGNLEEDSLNEWSSFFSNLSKDLPTRD